MAGNGMPSGNCAADWSGPKPKVATSGPPQYVTYEMLTNSVQFRRPSLRGEVDAQA